MISHSVLFIAILLLALGFPATAIVQLESPQSSPLPNVIRTGSPVIPRWTVGTPVTKDTEVELRIGNSGSVESVEGIAGNPLLLESTRTACLQWKFEPADSIRLVRLTFLYSKLPQEQRSVLVLPYAFHVAVSFPVPPQTVSYVPSDFVPGKIRCEVHKIALRQDMVDIRYGLMAFRVGYFEAEKTMFPHAGHAFGGCVIDDESPKRAVVLYCSKCRQAEERWGIEHRKAPFSTTG